MERKSRNYEPMIMVQKAEVLHKDSRCKQKEYSELVEGLYKFFNDNQEYFEKLVKSTKKNAYLVMIDEYEIENFDCNSESLKEKTKEILMFI